MQNLRKYRATVVPDVLAGLTGAVAGAPQAIGFALLAGVPPVFGLYSAFVGTIVGAIFGSSVYMTVGPTNALALIVGSALLGLTGQIEAESLFVLTFLVGIFMLLFGVLKLGDLTRFVSNAVMTGFISGAGTLIILGQLAHMTGFPGVEPILTVADGMAQLPDTAARSGSLLQPVGELFTHLHMIDVPTTIIGLIAAFIIFSLHHTRFRTIAVLTALVVATTLTQVLNLGSIELVGSMPHGLPLPILPNFSIMPQYITVALAMAVLATVQSAGLIEAMPQPNGDIPDASRDFTSQGIANVVTGLFQGMPVAGSLSRTAVNKSAGAKTRMANIFAGIFVGLSLIAIGGLIELIPLTALAAHLIVAAFSLISVKRIRMVWVIGWAPRLAMGATYVATLVLPLEYSIYVGVIISTAMYVYTSSRNIELKQLLPVGEHQYKEIEAPPNLMKGPNPILLTVHGHLYFAAIRTLEDSLPDPDCCEYQVVILRLRHNQYLGSTGIRFLQRYAQSLQKRHGRLIMTGISPAVRRQLERTNAIDVFGEENIYPPDEIIFASMEKALAEAKAWLIEQNGSLELKPIPKTT